MQNLINFRKNSKGDTIVEVMIALAVLGLAFGISYATANKGLLQARNAQEHSEALTNIDKQVELLRQAAATSDKDISDTDNVFKQTEKFCMSGMKPVKFTDDLGRVSSDCVNGLYNESITNVASPVDGDNTGGVFTFTTKWDGIGNLGPQQEQLTYKIYGLTADTGNPPPTQPIHLCSDRGAGWTGTWPDCLPPPTLALNLTANGGTGTVTATAGYSFTLAWSVTAVNAPGTTCTASGSWTGAKSLSGNTSVSTVFPADNSTTRTYTLSCHSSNGVNATKTVRVRLQAYSPSASWTLLKVSWANALGDHLYTTNPSCNEGSPWYTCTQAGMAYIDTNPNPPKGEVPLYRLYSPSQYDHFYTTSSDEVASAERIGYGYEYIAGYVLPYDGASCQSSAYKKTYGSEPLYRMYSQSQTDHYYTVNWNDYALGRDSWWSGAASYPPGTYYGEGIQACVW
jgi:hypothetical protein